MHLCFAKTTFLSVAARLHPLYQTLRQWGTDIGLVNYGPDWDWDVIEQAVARGPHRGALDPYNAVTVQEYIQYQVEAGFSYIFPWEEVRKLGPRKLKVSPMAVVPCKNRQRRIILYSSFPFYSGRSKKGADPIQESVNETTERLAPDAPVKKNVNVFRRLLHFINLVGTEDIFILAKINLLDGLWRILVEEYGKWDFAYMMPDPPGIPIRFVVPSALQMGWT